jgi:large subunit ribosomal protein L18
VRKTNKYVWVQVIEFAPEGDRVIAAAHSRELEKKYGWKGYGNSTPAIYLTGLLAALRAKKAGISYAVPDIGLHKPTKGARIFAAIKAANDAGLEVPVGDVVPSDERIKGEHIASYAEALKNENPEEYQRRFGKLLEKGLKPEEYPKHFEEVKAKILEDYKATASA